MAFIFSGGWRLSLELTSSELFSLEPRLSERLLERLRFFLDRLDLLGDLLFPSSSFTARDCRLATARASLGLL